MDKMIRYCYKCKQEKEHRVIGPATRPGWLMVECEECGHGRCVEREEVDERTVPISSTFLDDLTTERDRLAEELVDMTARLHDACHQLRETRVQLNRLTADVDLGLHDSETAQVV